MSNLLVKLGQSSSIKLNLPAKYVSSRTASVRFFAAKSKKSTNDCSSNLEHCNIGTIGHVDHGKTTLTAAITKVMAEHGKSKFISFNQIDKAPEEIKRGITINVAHVEYYSDKRHYAHTDCPGHADFVKNMISGTSQMDCAILVVAASEGQMPQTKEHLLLAQQIGLKNLIVYVNKCDLVDEEVIELVEIEISELIEKYGFSSEKTPIIYGSALLALNGDTESEYGAKSIFRLLKAADECVALPVRNLEAPFLFPVEAMFTIRGRGSVAIGTLKQGTITKGAPANLIGFNNVLKTNCSDIQVFKKSVPKCVAGEHAGILLRGMKITALQRGMILCEPNSICANNYYEATIYFLSKSENGRSKPVRSKYIQQMFSETWNIQVRIDMAPDGPEMIIPGESAQVRLTLWKKMILFIGQQFTIRENNVTVATGIITNKLPNVILPTDNLIDVIYTEIDQKV